MSPLVIILIVLLLFGGVGAVAPTWGYSRGWGWGPSGLIGVILVILLILMLTDRVHL